MYAMLILVVSQSFYVELVHGSLTCRIKEFYLFRIQPRPASHPVAYRAFKPLFMRDIRHQNPDKLAKPQSDRYSARFIPIVPTALIRAIRLTFS